MGDRYKRVHNKKNPFLPMLCSKPSIKDVKLPENDRSRSESSFSGDPLSPRISCMGQVKRNNRVSGLPISHRLILLSNKSNNNSNNNNNNVSYLKLKKFFSSKNLIASPAKSTPSGRGREMVNKNENCSNSFSVADLDPPLPVIKRSVMKNGEGDHEIMDHNNNNNLWKRRSGNGGIVLQSLQIQQSHLPKHRLQITTV